MDRRISYEISEQDAKQKISAFLVGKNYSQQNLTDLKKNPESIQVNGQFFKQNYVLQTGDKLEIWIREEEKETTLIPKEHPFEILYEDEDLMVINKPAGLPVHPSKLHPEDSLANALAYVMQERYQLEKAEASDTNQVQGQKFVFRCMNRLDKDTSGITIIAKHAVCAAILSRMLAEKAGSNEICSYEADLNCREYIAIVEGHFEKKEGKIDAPIARKEEGKMERVIDFEKGDRAVTHYHVLREFEMTQKAKESCGELSDVTRQVRSLVSLRLETGRTHQIRVHMKHIGHPLIGDFLYNPTNHEMKRQALHAYHMTFMHPMTGEKMEFFADIPLDMEEICG